jgi:hypothetical protein
MSKKLNKILNGYLNKRMTRTATLGGDETESFQSEENSVQDRIFVGRLQSFLNFNRNLIVVVYAVIIAVVIFLGLLIWFQKSNLTFVLGLLGGQGAGIYFGITKMQRIYKENFVARMILTMIPNAKTKEEKDSLMQMMKDFLGS